MRIEHPSQTLTEALGAALYKDLSSIQYQHWTPAMKKEGMPQDKAPLVKRRPRQEEVSVVMFPETWSSTALGYGGIGGAAMTPAYTVIIVCRSVQEACVYWGGSRLGAKLDLQEIKDIQLLKDALDRNSTVEIARLRGRS